MWLKDLQLMRSVLSRNRNALILFEGECEVWARQIMAVLPKMAPEDDLTLWEGVGSYVKYPHHGNCLLHFICIQWSWRSWCVNRNNALPFDWLCCFFLPLNNFNTLINNDVFNAFSLVHIKYVKHYPFSLTKVIHFFLTNLNYQW